LSSLTDANSQNKSIKWRPAPDLDEHVSRVLKGLCEVEEIDQMLVVLEQMQLSPVRQPILGGLRVSELIGVRI